MQPSPASGKTVRFGMFEADLAAGELRKRGRKVPLQDQPFQVLALLLRHPGEIVTREELQQALWPADTFVEFDESLNKAVQKLRQALGDSADNPRFVETLSRKGYRFIAPVDGAEMRAPPPFPAPVVGRRAVWTVALLALVVLAVAVVFLLLNKRGKAPEAPLMAVPLTSYRGIEHWPSFSPDGAQVAFTWCPEDPEKSCETYIKQIGVEPPFQLTDNPAGSHDPAWSPDGRTIAFSRELSHQRYALVLIPQRGGRERVLAEFDLPTAYDPIQSGSHPAWTPDSKWLIWSVFGASEKRWALYLVSIETGQQRRLTSPPADSIGDSLPDVSPDGRTLAFTRESYVEARADVYLLRLGEGYTPLGEPMRVRSDTWWNEDPAWTPDGKQIVFATDAGLSRVAVSRTGTPRKLAFTPQDAGTPAVSRQGNRLAFVVGRRDANIWRVELRKPGRQAGAPSRFISSTRLDHSPAYSPDGKRIAFVSDRSGNQQIWMCDSDGSNPVQLTSASWTELVRRPRWAPNGEIIAFDAAPGGNQDVYVVSANGGVPRRLTADRGPDMWPDWSRDGQSIYFVRSRGGTSEIYKIPTTGGEAVQITRNTNADLPQASPDGSCVYYSKGWPNAMSIWRVPADGGEGTKVLDGVLSGLYWTVAEEGIYFVPDKTCDISIYEFATGKTRKILTIERPLGSGIAVSPDHRTVLYTQVDEVGTDLMLVENFR